MDEISFGLKLLSSCRRLAFCAASSGISARPNQWDAGSVLRAQGIGDIFPALAILGAAAAELGFAEIVGYDNECY
jgi:hypothetical protein